MLDDCKAATDFMIPGNVFLHPAVKGSAIKVVEDKRLSFASHNPIDAAAKSIELAMFEEGKKAPTKVIMSLTEATELFKCSMRQLIDSANFEDDSVSSFVDLERGYYDEHSKVMTLKRPEIVQEGASPTTIQTPPATLAAATTNVKAEGAKFERVPVEKALSASQGLESAAERAMYQRLRLRYEGNDPEELTMSKAITASLRDLIAPDNTTSVAAERDGTGSTPSTKRDLLGPQEPNAREMDELRRAILASQHDHEYGRMNMERGGDPVEKESILMGLERIKVNAMRRRSFLDDPDDSPVTVRRRLNKNLLPDLNGKEGEKEIIQILEDSD
jgi:hypothetical protein